MHSEPLLKRNLGHILLKSIWRRKFDIFESNNHNYIAAFVAATLLQQYMMSNRVMYQINTITYLCIDFKMSYYTLKCKIRNVRVQQHNQRPLLELRWQKILFGNNIHFLVFLYLKLLQKFSRPFPSNSNLELKVETKVELHQIAYSSSFVL